MPQVVVEGDDFLFIGGYEVPKQRLLGNWWMRTVPDEYPIKTHFLDRRLRPLCGAPLKGNMLYPEGWDWRRNERSWSQQGDRCERCGEILKSREEEAERAAMRQLRKSGLHVQHDDTDYRDDDGHMPMWVTVYAPIRGLAEVEP